jgi:chaperonin GroES
MEEVARDAVRVALHVEGPTPDVREDALREVDVVADEVALREGALREEHLLRVRDANLVAPDSHRRSIVVLVLEEPQRVDLSLEPLDDHVVVQPSDEESETRLGLIIPASAETECRTGVVTAVGTEASGVEPGDKVLFPKSAGYEVRLGGAAVRVIRRGELIARVND